MNQAPRRPDGNGPGSVKAARERAAAGALPLSRPFANTKPPGSPKAVAISRPAPMPQWPLTSIGDAVPGPRNNSPPNRSPPTEPTALRGSPPRRPPRPSYVPSILDASRIQDHTPAFHYRQQQAQDDDQHQVRQQQPPQPPKFWEQNYSSSPHTPTTPGSGLTGASSSSRASTTSSYDEIPDFPVPAVPELPLNQLQSSTQRTKSIGPPPTSRRGASSYYSQSSYVAPIPEEMPEHMRNPQHGSFASSHVMPREWANGPTNYSNEDDDEYDYMNDQESRGSGGDHDESSTLVRKASLGRQYKPSLTTVRSSSSSSFEHAKVEDVPKVPGPISQTAMGLGAGASGGSSRNLLAGRPFQGSQDGSMYESRDYSGTSTPPHVEEDPRVLAILGGLEKGGAIERGTTPPTLDQAKRPSRLDMDAVHKAEARGSLTSLSDLIRRATKVRSNLDRGKTASRLGMLDMFGSSNPNLLAEKARAANHRSDSLSGMLGSFPQPSQLTPQGERANSRWPSPFANSNLNLDQLSQDPKEGSRSQSRRRCCGMPIWAFTILLILLFLLIAAAVVVPIVLIVLPRQAAANKASGGDLAHCSTDSPCANGGFSVVSLDACRCVCTNGFTGSSCDQAADSSCVSNDIGDFKKATVGASIPRLFSASLSKFSIPLNSTTILSTFSFFNVSCSDEESLISFNRKTQRRSIPDTIVVEPPAPMVTVAPRNPTPASPGAAITSYGVVLASSQQIGAPTAVTVKGTATSSKPRPRPTPTLTTAATPTPKGISPTQGDLDFARVAILWVLQVTSYNVAVTAQTALKLRLVPNDFVATIVDVGNGVQINFMDQRVSFNGTTVGLSKSS